MNRKIKFKAFTLLELLLSVSILTIISSVLFSFFYSGKMVYKRLNITDDQSSKIDTFFQILSRDIEQITEWQNCFMILNAQRLYFYTANEEGMGNIRRIDYFINQKYSGNEKISVIERCERKYPLKQEEPDEALKTIQLLDNCKSVSFKVITKRDSTEVKTEDDKKPVSPFIELPQWKLSLFLLAITVDIQNLQGMHFKNALWLPMYKYDLQKTSVITMSDEELEKIQKTENET